MPQFDGSSDAYWWLIFVEKHFDAVGTPKIEKLLEVVKVLRNRAYGGSVGVDAIYMLVSKFFTTLAF
jgi:hypothetical protein